LGDVVWSPLEFGECSVWLTSHQHFPDFNYLIDRFFNDSFSRAGGSQYSFVPKVDITEEEKAFEIQVAVPQVPAFESQLRHRRFRRHSFAAM